MKNKDISSNSWLKDMFVPLIYHKYRYLFNSDFYGKYIDSLLVRKTSSIWYNNESGKMISEMTSTYMLGFGKIESSWCISIHNPQGILINDLVFHSNPYSKAWQKFEYDFSVQLKKHSNDYQWVEFNSLDVPEEAIAEMRQQIENCKNDEIVSLGRDLRILDAGESLEEAIITMNLENIHGN